MHLTKAAFSVLNALLLLLVTKPLYHFMTATVNALVLPVTTDYRYLSNVIIFGGVGGGCCSHRNKTASQLR